MTSKEHILSQIRKNTSREYGMPEIGDMQAVTYNDRLRQFMETVELVGGRAVLLSEDDDMNKVIKELYPDARTIASSLQGIDAAVNPDNVISAQNLNGTDLGVLKGEVAVAENGCIWVPQTMKERAVMFISECLLILVNREEIVNNMHEAYARVQINDYGYGCFISGPSKTADIAQTLVMGAQAARDVTIVIR